MHIEPGVVDGAKIVLSYGSAAGAAVLAGKMALDTVRNDGGVAALAVRSLVATALVFCFFEILPHYPVGVSEVHLILGSTLYLLFGGGAAALGLALGLLLQGLFMAPFDLPQYGMNVTTLLVPLWALSLLAKRIVPRGTPYVDLHYGQALALSTAYQGGVVAWVAFWAFYGQGFGAETLRPFCPLAGPICWSLPLSHWLIWRCCLAPRPGGHGVPHVCSTTVFIRRPFDNTIAPA